MNVKDKAIALRIEGYSLGEIVVAVKKPRGTVYSWIAKVKLGVEAHKRLEKRKTLGREMGIKVLKQKQNEGLEKLRLGVIEDILRVNMSKTQYRLVAAVLYWAEGSKQLNSMQFMNSDPKMIKVFLFCLRKGYKLDEAKFRVLLHLHEYHDEDESIKYWATITGIDRKQFTKTYLKTNSGKRIHVEYPGSCKIKYYDSKLAHELTLWYLELSKILA